jgi:hypothetical protein
MDRLFLFRIWIQCLLEHAVHDQLKQKINFWTPGTCAIPHTCPQLRGGGLCPKAGFEINMSERRAAFAFFCRRFESTRAFIQHDQSPMCSEEDSAPWVSVQPNFRHVYCIRGYCDKQEKNRAFSFIFPISNMSRTNLPSNNNWRLERTHRGADDQMRGYFHMHMARLRTTTANEQFDTYPSALRTSSYIANRIR